LYPYIDNGNATNNEIPKPLVISKAEYKIKPTLKYIAKKPIKASIPDILNWF
jgi:hypothetical protein